MKKAEREAWNQYQRDTLSMYPEKDPRIKDVPSHANDNAKKGGVGGLGTFLFKIKLSKKFIHKVSKPGIWDAIQKNMEKTKCKNIGVHAKWNIISQSKSLEKRRKNKCTKTK